VLARGCDTTLDRSDRAVVVCLDKRFKIEVEPGFQPQTDREDNERPKVQNSTHSAIRKKLLRGQQKSIKSIDYLIRSNSRVSQGMYDSLQLNRLGRRKRQRDSPKLRSEKFLLEQKLGTH